MGMAEHSPSLDFSCPVCGAIPKERCASIKGNFLSESHVERLYVKQGRRYPSDLPNSGRRSGSHNSNESGDQTRSDRGKALPGVERL